MSGRSFTLGRHVSLSLVLALFLQAAAVIWWSSAHETRGHFRDQKIRVVEQRLDMESARQLDILQRLARLEALAESNAGVLRRIETRLKKDAP